MELGKIRPGGRSPALVSLLATAASAAVLAAAAPAGAVTIGPALNQTPAFGAGCEVVLISNLLPAPPSCSMFDPFTAQTPRGQWRVSSASVRTGPRSGPMRFTMIQALRSKSGAGGIICCTASSQSPVFTPAANSTTRVSLNLPAVNTTELIDREQVEVVDYLGITLLSQAGSIAFVGSPSAATTFFAPAFNQGSTQLGGAIPYSAVPMIRGKFESCGASGSGASASATACAPRRFSVARPTRLLSNGTRARITAKVPKAGTLTVRQSGAGATLVRKSSSKVRRAGTAELTAKLNSRGNRVLRKRGRVKVSLRVTFKPKGGKASSKKIKVTYRR